MARGSDQDLNTVPPRRNPFRQEIASPPKGYTHKRAEVQSQLADQKLMEEIEVKTEKIEDLLQGSFAAYGSATNEHYITIEESETGTLLKIEQLQQRYASFLSENLLKEIEDPYLQNRLDEVISEYQGQILKPESLTRYGSRFMIDEMIFSRFIAKVKREILLYELAQNALEKEKSQED